MYHILVRQLTLVGIKLTETVSKSASRTTLGFFG